MPRRNIHDIVQRWEGNPVLTLDDMPFKCLALHNAAAVMHDNHYLLLLRVEDMRGKSFFTIARSENGFQFTVDKEPFMEPSTEGPFAFGENLGIEDARITPINGHYYITYTAHSIAGSRLALARTKDFKSVERIGFVTQPENRSGALMPEQVDGRYALLSRPLVGDGGDLWISYSKDLKYWGDSDVVMSTRGGFWDSHRIGVGCPPIATEQGWLLVYYGTKTNSAGMIYRIGVALLDKADPSKLINRCDIPILSPREYYERVGDVDNMVFTTGAILDERLNNLMVYYGAATNAICLGWAKMDMLPRKVPGTMTALRLGQMNGTSPRARGRDVIHRWEGNPLIILDDIPFPCNTVFNAACVKKEKQYLLLLRVEDLKGRSVLALARSEDGFHFSVDEEPFMTPAEDEPFARFETMGVEDPRITALEGWYYIVYTAVSRYGPRLGLARTKDFVTVERVACISEPENKDGVLFPRKIGGRYVRLDRPMCQGLGNIWISYSEDLVYWGDSQLLMSIRPGFWDCDRIGASAQPIETEKGWLEVYHGVKFASAGPLYRLGAVLLDREDPSKVIGRSNIPILAPREYYERVGDVNNVVFSCGVIYEKFSGNVKVYYGAADTCICVGTAKLDDLLDWCQPIEDGSCFYCNHTNGH